MLNRDRHIAEREWRSTANRAHRSRSPDRPHTNLVLLLVIFLAGLMLGVGTAKAQSYEALMVLQDRGWHGVGGDLQIHQPTLDPVAAPLIAVWQRVPVPAKPGQNPYGQWFYAKVLYHCVDRMLLVYAVIDGNQVYTIRELTGAAGSAREPIAGSPDDRAMRAVCGLYGYTL